MGVSVLLVSYPSSFITQADELLPRHLIFTVCRQPKNHHQSRISKFALTNGAARSSQKHLRLHIWSLCNTCDQLTLLLFLFDRRSTISVFQSQSHSIFSVIAALISSYRFLHSPCNITPGWPFFFLAFMFLTKFSVSCLSFFSTS